MASTDPTTNIEPSRRCRKAGLPSNTTNGKEAINLTNTTDPPIRAATYSRVSTDEQAQHGHSLAEQERLCAEFAADQGWELVEAYSDAGISGATADRPALQGMLADVDRFDVLIVWSQDRIGRDVLAVGKVAAALDAAGVRIESLTGSIELSTPEGQLNWHVNSAVAQFQRQRNAEAVRMALAARVRKGGFHGGHAPMGYRHENGSLVVVPEGAAIARRVFREYVAGQPLLAIAKGLDRERVPTVRGGRWAAATIRDMLKNPAYVGKVRINGEVHDGSHEGIIDAATWDRAQALLNATKGTKGKRARRRGQYLMLGGMLRCGECGEAMTPSTQRNPKADDRETYRCRGRNHFGAEYCSQPPVTRSIIDEAVWQHFARVGLSVEETRTAIERASASAAAEVAEQRARAERDAAKAAAAVARVKADYTSGAITAADWRDLRAELEPEAAAAEAAVAQLREREAEATKAGELVDAEETTLHYLAQLRAALAGEVTSAENVEGVRAALLRIYERMTLHRADAIDLDALADDDPTVDATAAGEYLIVVEPRPEAVRGLDDLWAPVLRREPLGGMGDSRKEAPWSS